MSHAVAPVGKEGRWRGDDFPAWLSPMLVKELRQGIQSGVFAWTFVGLQVAMFLLMAWTVNFVGEAQGGRVLDMMTTMFWLAVGAAMVVVVPLRGLGAVAAERAGNNLDLVRLTHLSAGRIVAGKWLALVAQAVLLATAVLPYLVLRYFLGGIDVLRDLEVFGWLAAASMTVAAAAVALSTLPLWMRIGAGIAAVPLAGLAAEAFGETVIRGSGSAGLKPLEKLGTLAVMAVYAVACLEFAAGRIAPAAENHAARKRLLALAIAAAVAAAGLGLEDDTAFMAILFSTGPLLAAFAIGAVVERPASLASVFAPFARRGLPGRLAAAILAPGWATGLFFVTVVWALVMCGWLGGTRPGVEYDRDLMLRTVFGLLVAATIVFPLPLLVYLPRVRMPLLLYALVQLVCFVVFVYSGVTWSESGSRRWEDSWTWMLVLPFPLAGTLSFVSIDDGARTAALAPFFRLAAVTTLLVVLATVARPWAGELRALGRRLAAARVPGGA